MIDRQPTNPGRVKLTLDDGTVLNGVLSRDDSPVVEGTPLNKATLFNSNNEERYSVQTPSAAFELLAQDIIITLYSDKWSETVNTSGYYEQTVLVDGMSENHQPIFALELGDLNTLDALQEAFSYIPRAITSNGSITFYAFEIPEIDVNIRLKGV